MTETKNTDKKSLRFLQGKNADWYELAKDCVSFAKIYKKTNKVSIKNAL